MQINGIQSATLFTSKSVDSEQKTRVPVIIDSKALAVDEQAESTVELQKSPAEIVVQDAQQANFVRLFSTEGEPSSNENKPETLPYGVQQYLNTAQLNSDEEGQRLLDEQV